MKQNKKITIDLLPVVFNLISVFIHVSDRGGGEGGGARGGGDQGLGGDQGAYFLNAVFRINDFG